MVSGLTCGFSGMMCHPMIDVLYCHSIMQALSACLDVLYDMPELQVACRQPHQEAQRKASQATGG